MLSPTGIDHVAMPSASTKPEAGAEANEPAASHRLVETRFEAMAGFAEEDHREAWGVFLRSARAVASRREALRTALSPDEPLRRLCERVAALPEPRSGRQARRLFETCFAPHGIDPAEGGAPSDRSGFLTGYYEPEVEGALEPSPAFAAPLLARPAGIARIGPGVAQDPYPERAAIEARIEAFEPVVWLRDWVEVFFVHVQGSARVRLPGGRVLRLVYDGRNGQPYTSIGRLLVQRGEMAMEEISLDRLKAWLRRHGQAIGDKGRAVMSENRSYIFFRAEEDVSGEGPIGGAGLPLTPLRSIAVDRTLWPYGLPFFLDAHLPWRTSVPEPFRRLTIAQDTGSAILGPARADLFLGSGEEAGHRAGDIRHAARFTVLLPRPLPDIG